MTTVVVSGALANRCGNGGGAWVRLNWVLGFKRLGFRVVFLEEIRRETCRDAHGIVTTFLDSVNLAFFRGVVARFGLDAAAALVYEGGEQVYGMTRAELRDLAGNADLLVNLGGHLTIESLRNRFRRKVFVDLDPGYTQIWHESGTAAALLAGHDDYFSVGENIGTSGCSIPTAGIHWRPIRPPVVLEQWPVVPSDPSGCFTTVASWRGPFGPVTLSGRTLGQKVHAFRKFLELPQLTGREFEMALDIHPAESKDLEALRGHGWRLAEPRSKAGTPEAFRAYVQSSAAEFSAAQGVYVETGSGWFSDRTTAYLASGKPVLVQDTGFSRNYPVGAGLVPFRTLEEAVAGAERIVLDYENQSRAARSLAENYFDSDKVLGRFVDELRVGRPPRR